MALALLEAIRSIDRPGEVLEDEVLSRTMPRRFGLSVVVARRIELYQEYSRQGKKLSDDELAEFMWLVKKRPDSAEIYFEMGARLAEVEARSRGRWLPRTVRLFLVKRAVQRGLRRLFGQRLGGFVSGTFALELSASPFVQLDPSGDACEVVTGFCQQALRNGVAKDLVVVKRSCETRGGRTCRWTLEQ